ncbi:MAG: hypothetical protein L6254_01470 [Candidatus Omnitrophica bacterium]|nr:hypothetical protein [Candidatus Omnitrophota bacterium]MCG2706200.1 hypothetical protein [Candidatus Omnitrophota bacterium]
MEKVHYELDPHNRLVIKKSGREAELRRFRKVLDGQFKVDKNSTLTYHVKAPVSEDLKAPHQVKLRGVWSLTKNHDLRLTLDKWKRQTFGDQLTLQGDIIDVHKNSLLFAVTTRSQGNTQSLYGLKLQGSWQADKNNRLTFRVKRGGDEYDTLAFDGIWQINKNHQIIYQYQKAQLKRRPKKIHTLTFKGYWDIKDKTRISYIIDKDTHSGFDFSAGGGSAFGGKTTLGIFKDNYIKYEIGIGLASKTKPVKRTITLYGSWKLKKDLGLIFEVEYENSKICAIIFGAEARLTDKDTVLFKLKNNLNREIGAELELAHQILRGDGEAFLRLLQSRQESVISAGAGWRW